MTPSFGGASVLWGTEVPSYIHMALHAAQEISKGQVHRPQVIPRTGGEAAGYGVQVKHIIWRGGGRLSRGRSGRVSRELREAVVDWPMPFFDLADPALLGT